MAVIEVLLLASMIPFSVTQVPSFYRRNSAAISAAKTLLETDSLPATATISANCQADLITLFASVIYAPWSWTMFDAWGVPESGLIGGNTFWDGRMNQCKRVQSGVIGASGEEITGRYCSLVWPYLYIQAYPTGMGICIPSSCEEPDVWDIFKLLNDTGTEIPDYFPPEISKSSRAYCAVIPDVKGDSGAIAAISVLCFFALLGVVGSLYDVITAHKRKQQLAARGQVHPTTESKPISNGVINASFKAEEKDGIELRSMHRHETDGDDAIYSKRWEEQNERIRAATDAEAPPVPSPMESTDPEAPPVPSPKEPTDPEAPPLEPPAREEPIAHEEPTPKLEEKNKSKQEVVGGLLLSFSTYSHFQKLASLEHPRGSYRCVHAIRFLSMAWIVLGHTWQLGLYVGERLFAMENYNELLIYMNRDSHSAINQMNVAVDTFFLLSALLTAVSFLKQMKKHNGKPPCSMFGLYYFHRFWRLTPVYMLIMMFFGTMFQYLGTGPRYPSPFYEAENCRDVWWIHMFYLNNLVPTEPCMGWTWYLACDFQFYVIAPVFLSLLYWKPKAGIVLTSLGLAGNLTACFYILHGVYTGKMDYFESFYGVPWTRCGSYFVGMFLGYILFRCNCKAKMNKIGVVFGWLISLTAICTVVYASKHVTEPLWANVLFHGIERQVFAAAVGWIVFACVTGYGGVINGILSWAGWVPLSRLTYTGFLVHPIIVYFTYYSSPISILVADWIMVYYFLGNLLLTLGACFIISAFLELPFMYMERVMFRNVKR